MANVKICRAHTVAESHSADQLDLILKSDELTVERVEGTALNCGASVKNTSLAGSRLYGSITKQVRKSTHGFDRRFSCMLGALKVIRAHF
jgi:hypothetical protein